MVRHHYLHVALCGFAAFVAGVAPSLAEKEKEKEKEQTIIERTVETGAFRQPTITFYLRLPAGHTREKPVAKGVLAFCTWQKSPEVLRGVLLGTGPLVKYATERNLALLTWDTSVLWETGKSYDQIDRKELREQDANFDMVARAWNLAVTQICQKEGLPDDAFLLYGFSKGAHWSNRLALRLPSRFLAVQTHVANSYDKPTTAGRNPLWLVTTGEFDRGRLNSAEYYRDCRKLDYPMILKMFPTLGHNESSQNAQLRNAFFDYALEKREQAKARKTTPAKEMNADLAKSGLTGDLLSGDVFRGADIAKIPEIQRVALPNEKVAEAWGYLRKQK